MGNPPCLHPADRPVLSPGHVVTDIIIFALPIRLAWKLNLPRGQRLSLFGIFGFGFLTCCFSLVRIGWLNIGRDGDDDSYYNVEAAGWSIGELACAMTVTCLPSLRPLIFKMRRPDKKRAAQARRPEGLVDVHLAADRSGPSAPGRCTAQCPCPRTWLFVVAAACSTTW